MKIEWLERSLLQGPSVAFVTNERQFLAAKKQAAVSCDDPMLLPGWHACVHSYQEEAGALVCIVAVSLEACKPMTGIEVAGLLTHEAVHVWQRVRDRMAAEVVEREMEAYAIQNIAQRLMRAYQKASGMSQ